MAISFPKILKTIIDLAPLKVDHCEYHTLFDFIVKIISNPVTTSMVCMQ